MKISTVWHWPVKTEWHLLMDLPLIAGDGNAAGCDGNRPLDVHRFVCEAARTAPAAVTSRCLAIGPFHLSIDGAAAWDAEDLVGDQMSSPRPSNCSPHEFPVQFRLRCWPSLPATGRLQQNCGESPSPFFSHANGADCPLYIPHKAGLVWLGDSFLRFTSSFIHRPISHSFSIDHVNTRWNDLSNEFSFKILQTNLTLNILPLSRSTCFLPFHIFCLFDQAFHSFLGNEFRLVNDWMYFIYLTVPRWRINISRALSVLFRAFNPFLFLFFK